MGNLEKTLKRLYSAVAGSTSSRTTNEKILELVAKNQTIPYDFKRANANGIYQRYIKNLDKIGDRGIRALAAFGTMGSIPVHLHKNQWKDIEYTVWETMDNLDGKLDFVTLIPPIQFPAFKEGYNEMTENEKIKSLLIEASFDYHVWEGALSSEQIFRDMSLYKMPELTEEIRLSGRYGKIPHKKIPASKRIPVFSTDSIADANAQARAVIQAYQRYKKEFGEILEELETSPQLWEGKDSLVSDYVKSLAGQHGLTIEGMHY